MNINKKWKKFLVVGCSHGDLIDPVAAKAVLAFKERYKPQTVVHLGDFTDTAALRAGAKGTSDEGRPIGSDIEAGLKFLCDLEPTVVFNGNHEARAYRLLEHHNAIVQRCAAGIVDDFRKTMKGLKAEYVEGWSIRDYRMVGNYKMMHGYLFSENACRDHAEAHGNIIFAHTHRAGMQKGRRDDCPSGYCVGTLSNIPAMDYASARRATLSWAGGFVWGEYCDTQAVCWLHEQPQGQTIWRLPL